MEVTRRSPWEGKSTADPVSAPYNLQIKILLERSCSSTHHCYWYTSRMKHCSTLSSILPFSLWRGEPKGGFRGCIATKSVLQTRSFNQLEKEKENRCSMRVPCCSMLFPCFTESPTSDSLNSKALLSSESTLPATQATTHASWIPIRAISVGPSGQLRPSASCASPALHRQIQCISSLQSAEAWSGDVLNAPKRQMLRWEQWDFHLSNTLIDRPPKTPQHPKSLPPHPLPSKKVLLPLLFSLLVTS